MSGYRDFDGVDDQIILANESNFDFENNQPHTFAIWTYWDMTAATGQKAVMSKAVGSGNFEGLLLASRPGSVGRLIRMQVRNAAANMIQRTSDAEISVAAWHCLGYTYSGSLDVSGAILYADGAAVTSTANANSLSASVLSDQAVAIATDNAGWADQKHAFAAIWNVALSAAEMAHFYGGGTVPRQANLVAWLPMQDGASPELDETLGANNGTVTGATYSATGGPNVAYNKIYVKQAAAMGVG
jgi:hypothetical protein